jgi:hypothetical protein
LDLRANRPRWIRSRLSRADCRSRLSRADCRSRLSRADCRSRLSRAECRSRLSRADCCSRLSRADGRSRRSRTDWRRELSPVLLMSFLMVRGRPTGGAPTRKLALGFPSEKRFCFWFTHSIWPYARSPTNGRRGCPPIMRCVPGYRVGACVWPAASLAQPRCRFESGRIRPVLPA